MFVNPTYEETFGLTTVEAQACGTPAVVYATDGCPETLLTEDSVLVVQGDQEALAHAVREIAQRGVRVDEHAADRLDKERAYEKYIRLYERVCGREHS